ncbi:MAG: cupin domain-containing protein [Alphaproteobacteria bacterium]
MEERRFVDDPGSGWEQVDAGVRRRILAHRPELMMVEVAFEAGAVGTPHAHPHVQSCYVAAGRFRVTVDGEVRELGAGCSFVVPPDTLHGVVALEPGRLIDAFTPQRADFLPAG